MQNTANTTGTAPATPGPWTVLVNAEGQYGLFPAGRAIPAGWSSTGFEGAEDSCVAYVDTQWTDLRPKSLR